MTEIAPHRCRGCGVVGSLASPAPTRPTTARSSESPSAARTTGHGCSARFVSCRKVRPRNRNPQS
jgi:hypothetical protein